MVSEKQIEAALEAALRADIIPADGPKHAGVSINDYLQYTPSDAVELGVHLTQKTDDGKPRWHGYSDIMGDEYEDTNRAILRPIIRAALEAALSTDAEPVAFMELLEAAKSMMSAYVTHVGGEPPLDWSNFEGPKRNVDWKPDDQDLIYTAINFGDDEWGDADEDAGQQIVERLLAAWKLVATSEQITFENAVRLLKERDTAEASRAEEWRLRRDTEGTRDAAKAACESLRIERDQMREALQTIANAPAWGAPDRWETTPAEVRQLARKALATTEGVN